MKDQRTNAIGIYQPPNSINTELFCHWKPHIALKNKLLVLNFAQKARQLFVVADQEFTIQATSPVCLSLYRCLFNFLSSTSDLQEN